MSPKLIQRYISAGDRKLRDWHLFLQRVTFGAALVLMSASVVSLHWACNLIGLRGWWEPVAWAVPLAMEGGMAAVASTATTIRKDNGSYYLSLWAIFSFVMLLAQASNIGHAITSVAADPPALPAVIPMSAAYVFACAFAALFPLGGTMFVHVSGFLRVRGAGAHWIDQDAEVVFEAAPVRAQRMAVSAPKVAAMRAQSTPEVSAQVEEPRTPAPSVGKRTEQQAAARAVFDRLVAEAPDVRPGAAVIWREAGLDGPFGVNQSTSRRWRDRWWVEHQAMA